MRSRSEFCGGFSTSHVMPRNRILVLQAFAVLAWLAAVQGLYVHFDVRQALAGDEFGSAGSISGDLAESVSMHMQELVTKSTLKCSCVP